jgi:hypothetical protein
MCIHMKPAPVIQNTINKGWKDGVTIYDPVRRIALIIMWGDAGTKILNESQFRLLGHLRGRWEAQWFFILQYKQIILLLAAVAAAVDQCPSCLRINTHSVTLHHIIFWACELQQSGLLHNQTLVGRVLFLAYPISLGLKGAFVVFQEHSQTDQIHLNLTFSTCV